MRTRALLLGRPGKPVRLSTPFRLGHNVRMSYFLIRTRLYRGTAQKPSFSSSSSTFFPKLSDPSRLSKAIHFSGLIIAGRRSFRRIPDALILPSESAVRSCRSQASPSCAPSCTTSGIGSGMDETLNSPISQFHCRSARERAGGNPRHFRHSEYAGDTRTGSRHAIQATQTEMGHSSRAMKSGAGASGSSCFARSATTCTTSAPRGAWGNRGCISAFGWPA